MRKFSIILILLLHSNIISFGNGGPPMALLREVFVDSLGNWTVELWLYQGQYIDSIQIGFSNGNSIVDNYTLIPPNDLVLIDNSNLVSPISVNPDGDYIILRSWGSGYWHYDSLAFGNYPGSYLDCISGGESYAYVECYTGVNNNGAFSIDETPTLGYENDNSGALADFTGDVYDPDGSPIYEGILIFGLEDLHYDIYGGGTFSGPIFAHRYYSDTITIKSDSYPYTYTTYTIEPIEFCATPGSTIEKDIICTTLVNVGEKIEEDPLVVVSPNPFSSTITFYWETPKLQSNDQVELFIYDQQGKQSLKEMIQPNIHMYKWTPGDNLPLGMYIYHLVKNGESISTGKIIRI